MSTDPIAIEQVRAYNFKSKFIDKISSYKGWGIIFTKGVPMKTVICERVKQEISDDLGNYVSPLLARIYAARGVCSLEEVQYQLSGLHTMNQLLGLSDACKCLEEALNKQSNVLILGDYDADGATSTSVAVSALRAFGFENVSYLVPNRFEYGYGLTPEIVEVAAKSKPDLLITVDNGISSIEGVKAAQSYGMKVLITDHHLPGDELPEAEAIVNPNQPGDPFPSKNLAGVGVIFYVMMGFRQYLRETGWFENHPEPNMAQLLDLVALGTVADVVILDDNNRTLVQQGLSRIRNGKVRPGIEALIEISKRDKRYLTAMDLGFGIGPRLNAAGRLEDMSLGIECLLSNNLDDARRLAQELDSLNKERREIEDEMKAQAESVLQKIQTQSDLPAGVCLYEPEWHQGVIGLVASRVKEQWHRPVVAFAQADDETIKGSARSIPGLHIRDTLDAIAKCNPDLLSKFGGHAMAAGLSLKIDDFKEFQKAFESEVEKRLTAEDLQRTIMTDGELAAEEMTLENAELLRNAGPWGQGFPDPVFHGEFKLVEQRLVGMYHLKLVLGLDDKWIDAIAFNVNLKDWPNHNCRKVKIVYRLDVNRFQGRTKLQLLVEYIEAIE